MQYQCSIKQLQKTSFAFWDSLSRDTDAIAGHWELQSETYSRLCIG